MAGGKKFQKEKLVLKGWSAKGRKCFLLLMSNELPMLDKLKDKLTPVLSVKLCIPAYIVGVDHYFGNKSLSFFSVLECQNVTRREHETGFLKIDCAL